MWSRQRRSVAASERTSADMESSAQSFSTSRLIGGGRSTLAIMSVTVELPAEAFARLEAEAARRGVGIDVVIAELVDTLPQLAAGGGGGRRLAISGVGSSGGERGRARDADELLAEGFGRD